MFNASTKEAIKAALSIVIAICLALWFQWEKPYWAAIAVAVMALNESFAHSINKGHNRLMGTLLGTGYAFFLIAMFSQDRFLFLTFFTLFLGICIFMSSDEKYGYVFSIGFAVCSIIACMGGFDSQVTFYFAVLRIQETLLGVITFSIVYRLIWPVNTEQNFVQRFEASRETLLTAMRNTDNLDIEALESNSANIDKLYQLLDLPLNGSYHLKENIQDWRLRIHEMAHIQVRLLELASDELTQAIDWIALTQKMEKLELIAPHQSLIGDVSYVVGKNQGVSWHHEHRTFVQHLNEDGRKVLQGVSMFVTSLLVWIYLPVPGGFIFPMIAGVFSSMLPTMPPSVIKDAFFGVIGTGTIILLQYIFIMPMMSELWQLALFYFVNSVVIWKVFATPKLMIHRILGINLLVVLTSGALNLTPIYQIETPLLMLTTILIVLMIAKLFTDLFRVKSTA
ncbi:fusaric acid resistance protein [Vibrio lentus]|uniref:Fusaric acid resistance protein n=1 Tax=Vibrio lentus TaxID=136468 RepID=A0AB36XI79_9VIBR|nr:FUSC family protein [Vibrio lentus]MCC4838281.1 FUSC family protein [Vibrio lentus]PMG47276.1 fusaric acid resistance protein [Vibrio lentus]PMI11085.1 fusaric acid resistance protein [Vibrio lentus]PMK34999.1 fusaric acid resistance protein [Vibrio lentus]PMK43488.1 fusaric acid resistance protein [Vibrio lentus]